MSFFFLLRILKTEIDALKMIILRDYLLKSRFHFNPTVSLQRAFTLSAIHFRRRIKHPTYQYFPYQKYDSSNPIPHRDRVPVWR